MSAAPTLADRLGRTVLYQVYPQSFADGNGDGMGDLAGLAARLDYLAWLGVDAVWISPCFVSPFRDAGYDVKVAKFPFSANGKANGLGEPVGFVKLIADAEHLELLGGHLIGPDVSELLPELTLAQKWDLTVNELARNVHIHPTLSEALQECFHGLAGHMINF